MTATVGELLDQVQRASWDMAVSLPDDARARAKETGAATRAMQAAWPALAATTARALQAVPLPAAAHRQQAAVVGLLQRQGRQGLVGEPDPRLGRQPDPRLARMGLLLGAVADVLVDQPRALDDVAAAASIAARDRIAAAVETAARFARATADVAPRSASTLAWRKSLVQVTDELRALVATHPSGRAGLLDEVTAVRASDTSVPGAVRAWRVAVEAVVADPSRAAASGLSLRMASLDLALASRAAGLVLAAGGEAGTIPVHPAQRAHRELTVAAGAWQSAGAAWTAQVRILGRADPAVVAAGRHLREQLAGVVLDEGDRWASPTTIAARLGSQELPGAVQVARRIAVELDNLAPQLERCIGSLVASSAVVAPARGLAGRSDTDPSLLPAIARGQWVPVPSTSSVGRALVTTARAAATATHRARDTAALTAPFPVELSSRPALSAAAITARSTPPRSIGRGPGVERG